MRIGLLLSAAIILAACDPKPENNTDTKSVDTQDITQMSRIDPGTQYDWLEDVEGEESIAQVEAWNAPTLERLKSDPVYDEMYNEGLEILNSSDKIPYVSYRGGYAYNFWQDDKNVRGVWRRTTLDDYMTDSPSWETLIDFDELSEKEDANWVYKGVDCLAPQYTRCMVSLSNGGKDAVERREFNINNKRFIANGFKTEESKGSMEWLDANTVLVGVDFGEGTMTDSGYPMVTKLWKRGTPISEATEVMRGQSSDVGVWPSSIEMPDGTQSPLIYRSMTFYDSEVFWINDAGDAVKLPIPEKADLRGQYGDQVIMGLNEDWRDYTSGDFVSFSVADFADDGEIADVHMMYSPSDRSSIENIGITKNNVLVSVYENVQGKAFAFDFVDGAWVSSEIEGLPSAGSVSIGSTNDKEDVAFIQTESFLSPDTLWMLDTSDMSLTKAKALPEWFDASTMVAEQKEATSTDGTKIPYFIVHKKGMEHDGSNPTLLYGYGGFQVSLNPSYSALRGKIWLERGGVYVLANIRGGGEFGPDWHQAGLKTERQKIYDDFIAVAEDVIDHGVTSPGHLGIEGGSNGGLLMGVMFTQRPDLFNAVVCAVPLLDMKRYHTLLAGASWMGEYGDPADPVEGTFLDRISPFHNVREGVDYPEMLLLTSTKDDRVHPAHARKMAALLEDNGIDFLYYENIDGGHSAAANLAETANRYALQHTYLMQKLTGDSN